jgi:uncharacterized protein (TIGR02996 family)
MNPEDAFLAAILANPEEIGPRLVYADWLEERGDPRGTWLRYAVERLPALVQPPLREVELLPAPAADRITLRWPWRVNRLVAGAALRIQPCYVRIRPRLWINEGDPQLVLASDLYACGLRGRPALDLKPNDWTLGLPNDTIIALANAVILAGWPAPLPTKRRAVAA